MNTTEIVLLAFGLSVLVGAVAPLVTAALTKKGINVQPMLDKAQEGIDAAQKIAGSLTELIPTMPGISVVDTILKLSDKGVGASEQLLKSRKLPADQRKANAVAMVESGLAGMGITVTPDLEKVIDGAVEAAVLALPKTGDEVKTAAVAALAQPVQAPQADTAAPGVTIDALNQAAATIDAAIAEKTAVQPAAPESGAVAPNINGVA